MRWPRSVPLTPKTVCGDNTLPRPKAPSTLITVWVAIVILLILGLAVLWYTH